MDLALPAAASADPIQGDPAQCRAEACAHCGGTAAEWNMRRRRRLDELAEIGTDLARMLRQQANAAQWLGTEGPVMFERLARAVRQTTALEAKFETDHQKRERQSAADIQQTRKRQKRQVRRRVEAAIKSDADPSNAERLRLDLHERLDDPDIEAEFGNRSIGEIVAAICQDLGLTPDSSAWPDELLEMDDAPRDRENGATLTPALSRTAGEGVQPPPVPGFAAGPDGCVARDGAARDGSMAPRPPRVATGRDPP